MEKKKQTNVYELHEHKTATMTTTREAPTISIRRKMQGKRPLIIRFAHNKSFVELLK